MVKVKIKTNKKRIYENKLSSTTVKIKLSAEDLSNKLRDTWSKLINKKSLDIRKLYKTRTLSENQIKIPLSKINVPIKVRGRDLDTGAPFEDTIIPGEIAALCESAKTKALTHEKLGPIIGRFPKPIIWTLDPGIHTAASDGVRIAFNPLFALQLVNKGKKSLRDAMKNGKTFDSNSSILELCKYFLFVLTHEAYHQLYRHKERAERKEETANGRNHDLANIAMDVEINRDIEKQLASIFAGATVDSGGCFDNRFSKEPWEYIFDKYYSREVQPPQAGPSQQSSGQQSQVSSQDSQGSQDGQGEQDDQNSQDGQNNQSGSQSQNNSQSELDGQQSQNSQGDQQGDQGEQSQDNNSQGQDSQIGEMLDELGISTDLSDKSGEYQDSYSEELQKELEKALGQNSSDNSDDQNDSSDSSGNEQGDQNDSSDSSGNEQDNSDSSQNLGNSKDNQNTGSDSSSMPGNSKDREDARRQAKEDVKKIMDKIKQQIDDEMRKQPTEEDLQKELENTVFETEVSGAYGGADMISKEALAEIAEEAGMPYTGTELTTDVNELNREYNKKNEDKLRNVSPDLGNKISELEDLLKVMEPLANWKTKLKHIFDVAMEGSVDSVRSKRVMSQSGRIDRYNPYKEVRYFDENAANIFYLIDNSGSMYVNGRGIFYQIFKDILAIEEKCKVLNSARAFFTTGRITPSDVAMWNSKTRTPKKLAYLDDQGDSGGTDIPGNVVSVTKLKKPYYYKTGDRHTTIIVFTDGLDYGWEKLQEIPAKIRKDVVFIILNSDVKDIIKTLGYIKAQGIPMRNLIGIDTSKFGKLN